MSTLFSVASCLAFSTLLSANQPSVSAAPTRQQQMAQPASAYDAVVATGYQLLTKGDAAGAYASGITATNLDATRFEGFALAALGAHAQKHEEEAEQLAAKAASLAPAAKQPTIAQLLSMIRRDKTASSPEEAREVAALKLILEDADKVTGRARDGVLLDYFSKSRKFLKTHPMQAEIWTGLADVSMALDDSLRAQLPGMRADDPRRATVTTVLETAAGSGKTAGLFMVAFGFDQSHEPGIQQTLAKLQRKDWLLIKTQADAEDALGEVYSDSRPGSLVEQNAELAREWFRRASEHGQSHAQYRFGQFLVAENDRPGAVKWFEASARQGNIRGAALLGALEIGLKRLREGAEWLQFSADRSDVLGLQLAAFYLGGEDLKEFRNTAKAISYGLKGVELTKGKNPNMFSVLSVAYCGNQQYAEAENATQRAIAATDDAALKQQFQKNLDLCLARRPR